MLIESHSPLTVHMANKTTAFHVADIVNSSASLCVSTTLSITYPLPVPVSSRISISY